MDFFLKKQSVQKSPNLKTIINNNNKNTQKRSSKKINFKPNEHTLHVLYRKISHVL